jgi:hypothetical protein
VFVDFQITSRLGGVRRLKSRERQSYTKLKKKLRIVTACMVVFTLAGQKAFYSEIKFDRGRNMIERNRIIIKRFSI